MKVIVDAAAKINLFLDILGELDNGYHSLLMVMQSVSVYDTVTIEKSDKPGIRITCSEPSLPTDRGNIAYRAAQAFFEAADIRRTGLDIHIEKRIPFAAGLAGGSADAAAVICGLNKLFDTKLCESALCSIGIKIGSDIPFCISGGTKLVENTGEKLMPLPAFSGCYIVLAKPEKGISTAQAYGAYDKAENIIHPDSEAMLDAVRSGDLINCCKNCANVFEQVAVMPEIDEIKSQLAAFSPLACCMSGSGPTVFALFDDVEKARAAEKAVREAGSAKDVFLCEPVGSGVKFQ